MKYLISHRGNISGKFTDQENTIPYIETAISMGYDVEIDIWIKDDILYLGHDAPEQEINLEWLKSNHNKLWIHCKNLNALRFFNKQSSVFNYFFHDSDKATLTSQSYMWVYPGEQPLEGSIAVLPEMYNDDISKCIGICSDYIINYK
ncbi:MAG: hypothetical protein P8I31_05160 [Bacteroidia bacterium]|nr:hypothetical protein [Bacteroidia bacterium]